MCMIKRFQVWFVVVIAFAVILTLSCTKSTEPVPEPVPNYYAPQTTLDYDLFYVNAESQDSPEPGIYLSWSGYDVDDGGPAGEFEWRLYGPFEPTAELITTTVLEVCVYDSIGDSDICSQAEVLCLDSLPEAVGGLAQPLVCSQGPNFGADPQDVWVTDLETTIYDVYKDLGLTSTCKYQFAFWVRSRDQGDVPDPSPAFGQFMVYQAMHEYGVMVIDETGYTTRYGRWAPSDMDTSKAVFYNLIHAAGYTDFDTTYSTTEPMHYFYSATKKNIDNDDLPTDVRPNGIRYSCPMMIDILAHRIIIYYNDDSESGPNESTFGMARYVFDGLEFGIPSWILSRNLGNVIWANPPQTQVNKSLQFQTFFGVQSVICESWLYGVFDQEGTVFNEQFTGATASGGNYPALAIDTSLLDSRYPRMKADVSHVIKELPEVGICNAGPNVTAIYQYQSKHSEGSYFHGKTCAVTQEDNGVRTACWLFTPTAVEASGMQEAFNTTVQWLEGAP